MDQRMTSWTLNAVLAAMATAALVLPEPSEIRKALEYGQEQRSVTVTTKSIDRSLVEVLPTGSVTPASIEVRHPIAAECLLEGRSDTLVLLSDCIDPLVHEVAEFDRFAAEMIEQGLPVRPVPEIEMARLALVNLCRAKWSAQIGQPEGPDLEQCQAITVGIAY